MVGLGNTSHTSARGKPLSLGLLTGVGVGLLVLVGLLLFFLTQSLDLGPGPSDATLRNDLLGQDLYWSEQKDSVISSRETLSPDTLLSSQIIGRLRDTKAGTEQITARLAVATTTGTFFGLGESRPITIQGRITVLYRHYDQGWHFEGVPQKAFEFHLTAEAIASATAAVEATAAAHRASAAAESTAQANAQATADTSKLAVGDFNLDTVYMTSADEGWAGGGLLQGGATLLHYQAGKWQVAHNLPGDAPELADLSMTSPQDGWAVGISMQQSQAVLLHYTGQSWEKVRLPDSAGGALMFGLHMTSPTDGWLAGWGKMLHYDGSQWNVVDAGLTNPDCCIDLDNLFMVSAEEGWAIGSDAKQQGAILHYQGGHWQNVNNPEQGKMHLDALYMTSANDGWIFGSNWRNSGDAVTSVALHYDGTSWQKADSPSGVAVNAVYMTSPAEGWAVGEGGALLHYQNGRWSQVASPAQKALNSIYMTSEGSGWAVGEGVILQYQDGAWRTYAP